MVGPLLEKIEYEYETFILNLKLCSKDNIIARSDEIQIKWWIMQWMKDITLPDKYTWYLLAEDNVLELLYRHIKEQKTSIKDLECCIRSYLERLQGQPKGGKNMSAKSIILKEQYEQYRKMMAEKERDTEIIFRIDEDENILLAFEWPQEVKK